MKMETLPLTGQTPDEGPVPTLTTAAALLSAALLPVVLARYASSLSYGERYRLVWGAALALNCAAVSFPGRFDAQMADGKISVVWRTLFAPSGWAFSIWGFIYISELLSAAYVAYRGEEGLRIAVVLWLAGNLYQSLWCVVFRPAFKKALWLPALMLMGGALSLAAAHYRLTLSIASAADASSRTALFFLRFPLALHSAWLAAASLLNLNGWAAVSALSLHRQYAFAMASAYIAAALGTAYTLFSGDGFIGALSCGRQSFSSSS